MCHPRTHYSEPWGLGKGSLGSVEGMIELAVFMLAALCHLIIMFSVLGGLLCLMFIQFLHL